jgi:NAD(P)-dependent dehydrogenase (short-subunit alcohol dehydrogenase family)
MAQMRGKLVVITGATSGIGLVAAEKLASMGAGIILIARDRRRGEATLQHLQSRYPDATHGLHLADLSLVSQTERVGRAIARQHRHIDVLINNAGSIFAHRQLTSEGLERTFATNHMAYFSLTQCLVDTLTGAPGARIVNTASRAHQGARLELEDLQSARRYRAFPAYARSKLCNILFTRELARRIAVSRITANCLHPGFVSTGFGDQSGGWLARTIGIAKRFAISAEEGADTIVYLASAPAVAEMTGGYFYRRKIVRPSPAAEDDEMARALWSRSEAIAARLREPATNSTGL